MTFVDTSVILDVVLENPIGSGWSLTRLKEAASAGPLMINDVVYAELSVGSESLTGLDAMLSVLGARLDRIPRTGLFAAAKAFRRYRVRGGTRTGVSPDFFIGGHAEVSGLRLLTRDQKRYRDYFPPVALIAPA